MSEYDPVFAGGGSGDDGPSDLERVRRSFAAASRPYLRSPIPWLWWAILLPSAALFHGEVVGRWDLRGGIFLWCLAILLGGLGEGFTVFRNRKAGGRVRSSPLSAWVFRMQGNLSLVALALSLLLITRDLGWALPSVFLLLVGHSFYLLGGLAFAPFRLYGLTLQAGGLLALLPGLEPLLAFAGVTGAANLWLALKVWGSRRRDDQPGEPGW